MSRSGLSPLQIDHWTLIGINATAGAFGILGLHAGTSYLLVEQQVHVRHCL